MLKDEQAHVAAIDKLEQQRQIQVTDYLEAKGFASTDKMTVADVIEAAEQQTEKDTLSSVRNRLMLIIEDLRKQNDLNQKLVFQSLQFVNLTLDTLRPRPEQMNYSGSEVRGTNTVAKKIIFRFASIGFYACAMINTMLAYFCHEPIRGGNSHAFYIYGFRSK